MSYIKAEDVLPRELIESIQKYIDGKVIYIPSANKQAWGSKTDTKGYLRERNRQIYESYQSGMPVAILAKEYALANKSIQRIIRSMRIRNEEEDFGKASVSSVTGTPECLRDLEETKWN